MFNTVDNYSGMLESMYSCVVSVFVFVQWYCILDYIYTPSNVESKITLLWFYQRHLQQLCRSSPPKSQHTNGEFTTWSPASRLSCGKQKRNLYKLQSDTSRAHAQIKQHQNWKTRLRLAKWTWICLTLCKCSPPSRASSETSRKHFEQLEGRCHSYLDGRESWRWYR